MKQRRSFFDLLPDILAWIVFALVLLVLAPIGFAVVMLDSRPSGGGAEPAAKIIVALLVLAMAAFAAFGVRGLATFLIRLIK